MLSSGAAITVRPRHRGWPRPARGLFVHGLNHVGAAAGKIFALAGEGQKVVPRSSSRSIGGELTPARGQPGTGPPTSALIGPLAAFLLFFLIVLRLRSEHRPRRRHISI
jgi:hypothetical protein